MRSRDWENSPLAVDLEADPLASCGYRQPVVLPHVILLPDASCAMLPASLDDDMTWRLADLVDQPLDSLLPPGSDSLLKGMQLSLAVPSRVPNLELDE
jgi:hypothetical protein